DKGLADGAAVTFASNKLTVIVPTPNPAGIKTPADLARAGVKVIAAGEAVPITKYATQLVANLAREAGYPANFVGAYTANIVSREDNASGAVAKIERAAGAREAVDHTRSSARARGASGWGDRSIAGLAGLFALFLGLPVLTLVVRAILDGSLANAIASPVVLDALSLSLVTTAISLLLT